MDGHACGLAEFPAEVILGEKEFFLQGIQGDGTGIVAVQIQDHGPYGGLGQIRGRKLVHLVGQIQDFYDNGAQHRGVLGQTVVVRVLFVTEESIIQAAGMDKASGDLMACTGRGIQKLCLVTGTGIFLKKIRGNHQHHTPVGGRAVVVNPMELMPAYDNEIPWFQGVSLILHQVPGIAFQKQQDLIVIVVVKLEMGIGGGLVKGLIQHITGFHNTLLDFPPSLPDSDSAVPATGW